MDEGTTLANRGSHILEKPAAFFDDAAEDLNAVSHFGVLTGIMGDEQTRRDYVLALCKKLFDLSKAAPGHGLASNRNFPGKANQKNPWKGLGDWTGLDICQAWAVLLNAGHLFGTFATERGLLFQLDRDLEARAGFVQQACECDDAETRDVLKRCVEELLDHARLHRFHYALALWRLRLGGTSSIVAKPRCRALKLIRAFLEPPNRKIARLTQIYRGVRRLTYLEMHAGLRDAHVRVPKAAELSTLFPVDAPVPCDSDLLPIWELLDAVDAYEAREFFGSAAAASSVLGHIGAFKEWWQQSALDIDRRVDALFSRPNDWPKESVEDRSNFVRLQFPSRVGWLHEVRLWLVDRSQEDPWAGSNFLITPPPEGATLQVDLYSPAGGVAVMTIQHVVLQLSRALANAEPTSESRELWLTTARFVAAAFSGCLRPGYKLRVTPVPARRGHLGCATVADTYEQARAKAKRFIPECTELQRAIELRQLIAVGDSFQTWRVPAMMMFASTEILDRDGTVVGEIDGLLGRFIKDTLVWTVIETKSVGGGESQLIEHVANCMEIDGEPAICSRHLNGQNVWSFDCCSPDPISVI